MSVDTADIGKWLEGHHHTSTDRRNGEVINVYAIAGPPVFGSQDSRSWDFDIEVPLWGVVWILKGSIDLDSLAIDASFAVRIPIWGTIQLGRVKGNLSDGVSIEFGISGILSGKATFYVKDGWLYVDLSATIFGSSYGPLSIRLIPLP